MAAGKDDVVFISKNWTSARKCPAAQGGVALTWGVNAFADLEAAFAAEADAVSAVSIRAVRKGICGAAEELSSLRSAAPQVKRNREVVTRVSSFSPE